MKGRHFVLFFAFLQLLVAFLTDSQTFTHEESMWHYIGRNWFRFGLTPYEGGVDNKSPLIFAVFGLSDILFGINYWFPRLIGVIVQSAGLYFLYRIALHLAGRQAAMISVTIYGFALLWRTTGGKYVSFTETYAVTCIIVSIYYFITAGSNARFFISGLLAGLALGWRLSAFSGILAIGIYSILKRRNAILPFSGGLLATILALLLMAVAAGIDLQQLYFFTIADNFGAGSTTDHSLGWQVEKILSNFFYSELIIFYPAVIAYFLMKKQFSLLTIWLVCEFIGIALLGIYARPHFKQLLPALSLTSGIGIAYFASNYRLSMKLVMTIIIILFIPKNIEPLRVLKKLVTGIPDNSGSFCLPPFPRTDEQAEKKLGRWIRDNTSSQDTVLVAGFGARVQLYSERFSPSVYFNVTQTEHAKKQFMKEVNQSKPDLLAIPVFPDYKTHVHEDLRNFIDSLAINEYDYKECRNGYSIYRLKKQ
ncbi:MAG TPA: glycosyltransferase family 39 protein [Chitinophagaceae bacterium]